MNYFESVVYQMLMQPSFLSQLRKKPNQKKDVSKACNCWNDVKLNHLMSSTSRCKVNRSAISEKKSKCQLVFMRCRELELASIKSFYECPGNI